MPVIHTAEAAVHQMHRRQRSPSYAAPGPREAMNCAPGSIDDAGQAPWGSAHRVCREEVFYVLQR